VFGLSDGIHGRAALLSAVYVVSYIAFNVPALVAGLLTTHIGLRLTSLGYGAVVALIALATFGVRTPERTHSSTAETGLLAATGAVVEAGTGQSRPGDLRPARATACGVRRVEPFGEECMEPGAASRAAIG
jgi:hypothetical protein